MAFLQARHSSQMDRQGHQLIQTCHWTRYIENFYSVIGWRCSWVPPPPTTCLISSIQKLDQDTLSRYCDLVCPSGWPPCACDLCLWTLSFPHAGRKQSRVPRAETRPACSRDTCSYTGLAHSCTRGHTRPRTAHSASGRESIHSPRQGRFTS